MATKESHCLNDISIACTRVNWTVKFWRDCVTPKRFALVVESYKIPYHCIPVPKEKRCPRSSNWSVYRWRTADAIVLARTCKIFPRILCEKYRHSKSLIFTNFLYRLLLAAKALSSGGAFVALSCIGATCITLTADYRRWTIIGARQSVIRRTAIVHAQKTWVRLGKGHWETLNCPVVYLSLRRWCLSRNKTVGIAE